MGHFELDEALLILQPEPLSVEIRQKAPPRLIVRVGNVVTRHGALPGHLADSGHWSATCKAIGKRPGTIPSE